MKKLITLIAIVGLFGFTTMAHATRGGEPNNTGCNGVGNANSPCQPSNNGGNGGNGGNVTVKDSGNSSIKNSGNSHSRSRANSKSTSNATGGKSVVKDSGNSTNTNRLNNTNDLSNKVNASSKNKLENNTKVKTGDVSASNEGVSNTTNVSNPVNVDASDNSSYEYKEVPQVASVFAERGQVGFTFSTPVGGGGFNKDTKDSKLIDTYMTIQHAEQSELLDEDLAEEATLKVINKLLKRSCGKKCMVGVEEDKEETAKPVTTNNFAR